MLRGLDRRITIERRTISRDQFGEAIEVWEPLVERRPASMTPLRGDERFVSDQRVARRLVEFKIRYSDNLADLNPMDRILEDPFTYDIVGVAPIGRNEGWSIIATARAEQEDGNSP